MKKATPPDAIKKTFRLGLMEGEALKQIQGQNGFATENETINFLIKNYVVVTGNLRREQGARMEAERECFITKNILKDLGKALKEVLEPTRLEEEE